MIRSGGIGRRSVGCLRVRRRLAPAAMVVLTFAVQVGFAPGPSSAAPRLEEGDVERLRGEAAAGNREATYLLAFAYERALGGLRADSRRAFDMYCAAAKGGHAAAAYRLGRLYWTGLGVEKDALTAVSWLSVAAVRGDFDASRMLDRFGLPPNQETPDCARRRQGRTGRDRAQVDMERYRRAAGSGAVSAMVHQLAPDFALDPDLVLAVIAVESNFRPDAVSPRNAQGLMQLIPATARRFGVRDPFDPVENLVGGMRYLRWLLDRFGGDVRLALAGYNAGEGAVDRHGGVPPFAETRDYVRRVTALYPAGAAR